MEDSRNEWCVWCVNYKPTVPSVSPVKAFPELYLYSAQHRRGVGGFVGTLSHKDVDLTHYWESVTFNAIQLGRHFWWDFVNGLMESWPIKNINQGEKSLVTCMVTQKYNTKCCYFCFILFKNKNKSSCNSFLYNDSSLWPNLKKKQKNTSIKSTAYDYITILQVIW